MNDPILESLNFALESDLLVEDVRAPSSSSPNPLYRRQPLQKNSKKILPSTVLLGEGTDTPCLIKGCEFSSPPLALKENKDKFLAHLLVEHRMVIDDVDKIANLHKYVIYWKEKFDSKPLTEYCVGFVMDEIPLPKGAEAEKGRSGGEAEGEAGTEEGKKERPMYFMLTPDLPEDKELRSRLWNNRLEVVLEVNREEREQQDFSRQCFFCREVFVGNRAALFDHLVKDHSFRIGKADNIVFVEEFFELISKKLNELICLHCEKVFKDKTILRDHMRKKGHKKLNENNPEYNRYYVINYLEPGKDWKALEQEDQEDEKIEEEWVETNEETPCVVCLLCSEQYHSFDDLLTHMTAKHNFDFVKIVDNLDFYQKVKVVNFIRRTVFLNVCLYCEKKFLERTILVQHVSDHASRNDEFPSEKTWNQPEYFFPTYENDQFLVLLDKDLENEGEDKDEVNSMMSSDDENQIVIPEDMPKLSSSLPMDVEELRNDSEYQYALGIKNRMEL